jgi:hypothetical protein
MVKMMVREVGVSGSGIAQARGRAEGICARSLHVVDPGV